MAFGNVASVRGVGGGGSGGGNGGGGEGGGLGANQSDFIVAHVFAWFVVEHVYLLLNSVALSNIPACTLVAAGPVHPETSLLNEVAE